MPRFFNGNARFSRDRHGVVDDRKLEHLGDVALLGRQLRDVVVVEQHPPFGRHDEARDDVEQRGLAAARRAEQRIGAAVLPDVIEPLQRKRAYDERVS